MVIGAIIAGVLICILVIISLYISKSSTEDYDIGFIIGCIIATLMVIEVNLLADIIGKPKPSALDVYQGKTTLEYTIRDGVKVDSIVVFKENYDGCRRITK